MLTGWGYLFDAFSDPNAVIRNKDQASAPSFVESNPEDDSKKEAEIQPEKEMPINETKQADNSNPETALEISEKKPPLQFNISEESDLNENKQPDDSNHE